MGRPLLASGLHSVGFGGLPVGVHQVIGGNPLDSVSRNHASAKLGIPPPDMGGRKREYKKTTVQKAAGKVHGLVVSSADMFTSELFNSVRFRLL